MIFSQIDSLNNNIWIKKYFLVLSKSLEIMYIIFRKYETSKLSE